MFCKYLGQKLKTGGETNKTKNKILRIYHLIQYLVQDQKHHGTIALHGKISSLLDYEQYLLFLFSSSKPVKQDGGLINTQELGRKQKISSKGVGAGESDFFGLHPSSCTFISLPSCFTGFDELKRKSRDCS